MMENESNLLEYYERTVKECMEECDGNCIMYSEGNCECVDANVLDHLRELQQYRAIGTVEEFKMLKDHAWTLNEICKDYSAIGTIDEFKALKLKEHKFDNCHNFTCKHKSRELGFNIGYDKAIDDFLKKICEKYTEEERKGNFRQDCVNIKQDIADIAEQMKKGNAE